MQEFVLVCRFCQKMGVLEYDILVHQLFCLFVPLNFHLFLLQKVYVSNFMQSLFNKRKKKGSSRSCSRSSHTWLPMSLSPMWLPWYSLWHLQELQLRQQLLGHMVGLNRARSWREKRKITSSQVHTAQ